MLHHGHWPIMQVNLCYMASETKKCKTSHIHTRLTALFPGPPTWAGTRNVKPIWILLKQETVSGSGISWAVCESATGSRQITMPTPHHSSFFTDRIPFRPPNQQCQSTEGNQCKTSLEQNFTACMPLQKATSSFRLEKYATLLVNCVTY